MSTPACPPPTAPALEVRGLNLWYGDFQALVNVSAAFRPRMITSLIGSSGCGKSTLLRCLNRMNDPIEDVRIEGEIIFDGVNIQTRDVALSILRKRVGMVFQRPNPLPISVYENVVFGLRIHRPSGELTRSEMHQAVEQALTEVGLWQDLKERLDQKATTLQLEQQQKLCIARLLPLKPEIILMDEPCSALDVEGTRGIEELMFALKGRFTLVIVTHNMAQARRASDECIFMLMGELIEHRRTEDLFLTPKNPKTAEYIEGRYG